MGVLCLGTIQIVMKSPFIGGEVVLLVETRKAVFRKEEYE